MSMRYRLSIVVALIVAALGISATQFIGTAPASAADIFGQGNGYTYNLRIAGDTAVVNVNLDVDDEKAVQLYRNVNTQRAKGLIQRAKSEDIAVQITFVKPVAPEIVREKAAAAGLTIQDFLLAGRSNEGRKITSIRLGEIPADMVGAQAVELPNGQPGGTLQGVMLVRGMVKTTKESLERWTSDPSVYMVDTTGAEAIQLVKASHAATIGNRPVEAMLHSPFWKFDW